MRASLRSLSPWILLLTALVCCGLALPAQAHRFAPSLLQWVELDGGRYNLVWKTPLQSVSPVPLSPHWPSGCSVLSASPVQLEGTGQVASWLLQCSGLGSDGLVGHRIGVTGLGASQSSAMLLLQLLDGREYQQILTPEQPDFTVPVEPGAGQVMTDYSMLGVEHIWGGVDHLLFVLGLLLLVGMKTRLLWTITAFTIGHSITLALVTLGVFDYPVALVEFTIAVSIFWLAVALSRAPGQGLFQRHPWWLAAGFGLLHGMGFAGALAATGLPQTQLPLALLFFNIGIEAGQIAFIAAVALLWYLLRRLPGGWHGWLRPLPVYLLGSLSALWCIERGLDLLV
jgi:hypothetical protein